MQTRIQVLSEDELNQVHAHSLELLSTTGVKVETARGRTLFASAGAEIEEEKHRVRLPVALVEECLAKAPRQFNLGGRRPGWKLDTAAPECSLVPDGGGIFTLDSDSGERRAATRQDWLLATRLCDTLDDFGCYWSAISGIFGDTPAETVDYWRAIFQNFSKHVQEATASPLETRWMLEVLQVVFGSRENVRQQRPVSFLLCPTSPLVMEGLYTDAFLETVGWGMPLAIMTMPLVGVSGPGSLISTLVLANSETLAFLCLAQIAEAGTPCLYAPVPAVANPHDGRFGGGEVEHSLFGAAVVEMARHYGLPVEVSAGGSDAHVPGIQSGYERALNYILPILSQPDLLVGPGLLGGSMIFSPEQLVIDLEIVRRCKRLSLGMATGEAKWLDGVIDRVGPGGNFLAQQSTRQAFHSDELYLSSFGCHKPYETWHEGSHGSLLDEAREMVGQTMAGWQPLPLDDSVEKELDSIARQAKKISG